MLRFSKKLSGEKRAPSCASTRAALRKPLLARFIPPSFPPPPSPSSRCSTRLRSALRAALGRTPKPRGRKEPSHGPKSSLRGGAGVGGVARGRKGALRAAPHGIFSPGSAAPSAAPAAPFAVGATAVGKRRSHGTAGHTDTRTGLPARGLERGQTPKTPKAAAAKTMRGGLGGASPLRSGVTSRELKRNSVRDAPAPPPPQLLFLSLFLF